MGPYGPIITAKENNRTHYGLAPGDVSADKLYTGCINFPFCLTETSWLF